MNPTEQVFHSPQRISSHLKSMKDNVIEDWLKEVKEEVAATKGLDDRTLLNSLPKILDFFISAMTQPPPDWLQIEKVSEEHAAQRASCTQYDLKQVLLEYHILQKILFRALDQENLNPSSEDRDYIIYILHAGQIAAATKYSQVAIMKEKMNSEVIRYGEERLNLALESSKMGIFVWNLETKILEWSSHIRATQGNEYAVCQQSSVEFWSRIHPDDRLNVEAAMQAAFDEKKGFELEIRSLWPAGEVHWVCLRGRAYFDEDQKITRITGTATDITNQKKLEQKLRDNVVKLEAEKNLREQFVSTLSHDLRTPLTAARLNLQLLERQFAPDQELLRLTQKIHSCLGRTDHMIQDLLDANRIRAGQYYSIEMISCHLNAIAEEVVNELSILYGDRFEVIGAFDIWGYWSKESLRRIFDNLLSNAIKYGEPGKKIKITLSQENEWIEIAIHNEGKQIPENQIDRLFEPFHRDRATSQKIGWGLGLTLVKGMAAAHGGSVSVSSLKIDGTTFRVRLPQDARQAQQV